VGGAIAAGAGCEAGADEGEGEGFLSQPEGKDNAMRQIETKKRATFRRPLNGPEEPPWIMGEVISRILFTDY
jgi:hypothetical protein